MPLQLLALHHVALICSDYPRSKHFYAHILGLEIIREVHRPERDSYKLDLRPPAGSASFQLELFSFPNPPPRPTGPEARGLRHLALAVPDLDAGITHLAHHNIPCEPVRIDEHTGARFTFFRDPDDLPIELYEVLFAPTSLPSSPAPSPRAPSAHPTAPPGHSPPRST